MLECWVPILATALLPWSRPIGSRLGPIAESRPATITSVGWSGVAPRVVPAAMAWAAAKARPRSARRTVA